MSETHSTTGPTAAPAPTLTPAQTEVLRRLAEVLGVGSLQTASFRDNVRVYLAADRLIPALRFLNGTGFQLIEVGGTDYLKYPGPSGSGRRFEVHYVLLKHENATRLVVKVGVDDPDPTLPSCVPLWKGADWMEREVFDMYGIRFTGHPDLRRILMPEEFTAFPLRKDYPLRGRGERHNFPVLKREQS
jgi:NADH-quinone oxidoreductase subunit C